MTSIPPNLSAAPDLAGGRLGESLQNLQPARLPVTKKKQEPLPEALQESLESLTLDRCSDLVRTALRKKKGDVRLRLARFGRKHAPFYRIHVAHSKAPRDGKFLEKIGYYDPRPGKDGQKRIAINIERAKYWLSVGAQPTDTVRHILSIAGLLPRTLPPMHKKGSTPDDEEKNY
ncbi:hypothetical protein KP509_13G025200 [Ceratopteris richardii]|uniref:30S ribosomal protein S16, chloroplastic n=1 Tax=Ceratopteris richardii TaxID=49495 RepID=A0A8T2TC95_CERRI|nr:hypothetical protein KP509_13G025200 [Ceratopteris richardii]